MADNQAHISFAGVRTAFTLRGTIGKAITWRYVGKYGRQDAMIYYKSGNPRTPAQEQTRARLKAAMAEWSALSPQSKATYNERAKGTTKSGQNIFVKEWMSAHPPGSAALYGQAQLGQATFGGADEPSTTSLYGQAQLGQATFGGAAVPSTTPLYGQALFGNSQFAGK